MQFSNPTTVPSSFTVSGGTIDAVITSVPFLDKDAFFWPAISGETFPPSLSSWSYSSGSYGQSYYISSGTTAGQVTGPALPRLGFNGKGNLHWECYFHISTNTAGAAAPRSATIGLNNGTGNGKKAFFVIDYRIVGGNAVYDLSAEYANGAVSTTTAVLHTTPAVASGSLTELLKLSIDVLSDGTVKFSINDVVVFTTAAGIWPASNPPASNDPVVTWIGQYITTSFYTIRIGRVVQQWT